MWYALFARAAIPIEGRETPVLNDTSRKNSKPLSNGQGPSEQVWNVKASDLSKPIFTAVYTADLDLIINELDGGKIKAEEAVTKLKTMRNRAEEPVVSRRAIPGTLPSEKIMYHALLGLAIIGSAPTAMTLSDSRSMNLPRPLLPANTHKMKISKKRVVAMLQFLGIIDDSAEGRDLNTMVDYLWQEAADYGIPDDYKATLADNEAGLDGDEMELGILRWMLFGIEANQPTWFERFCMPCGPAPPPPTREHPIHKAKLRRTNGELVKHDALTCSLCRNVAGCPLSDGREHEVVVANGGQNGCDNTLRTTPDNDKKHTIRLKFPSVVATSSSEWGSTRPFDEDDDR